MESTSGRSLRDTSGGFLRIVIPAKRIRFVLLFLIAWLGGWLIGEVAFLTQLPGASAPILLFWLAGWTLGGALALTYVAWKIAEQFQGTLCFDYGMKTPGLAEALSEGLVESR